MKATLWRAAVFLALARCYTSWCGGSFIAAWGLPWLVYIWSASAMHDAGHGSAGATRSFLCFVAACFGVGGTPRWIHKHNAHHAWTNERRDPEVSVHPLLRFHPEHKWEWWHRYQHWYAPLLYSLLHLDIYYEAVGAPPENVRGVRIPSKSKHSQFWWTPYTRLMFVTTMVGVPVLLGGQSLWWPLLLCLTAMPASLAVCLAFQPSHSNCLVWDRRMLFACQNEKERQMRETANYSGDSTVLLYLTGGLNLQVEHHVCPKLPFTSLPALRDELRRNSPERHHEFPTWWDAISDHWSWLERMSKP